MGKFEAPRGSKKAKPAKPAKPTTAKQKQSAAKPGKSAKSGKRTQTTIIVAAAVFAALIIGFFGYAITIHKSGAIFPNVYVAGVNVGGMTKEEATAAVQEAVDQTYGTSTLAVKLPDRTLSFAPDDTNVTMDVATAVDEAWNYGREDGIFKSLSLRLSGGSDDLMDIKAGLSFDEDYINNVLNEVAAEVKSERTNSAAQVAEDNSSVTILVGSSERSLDTITLYNEIQNAYLNNDFTPLEFSYDEELYSPVDLDALYQELCTDMADAYYDTEKKSIVDEVVGYGFDLAAAKQQQAMAVESGSLTLTLSEVAPEVTRTSLEEKLFHDVLGVYDSPHVYNPSRTNNLDLACKAIDGTVLNPGDIFSFNGTVGERTSAKGYQSATVYVSGESRPELGGGVCQVASTIYMATLLADIKSTERLEHMFIVTYVPMGMDATVYWGSVDYKFQNTTAYPLRIDATTANGKVHIALIGTKETDTTVDLTYVITSTTAWKDVEKVDESKPADYKQVQDPYTGYKVTAYKQYLDKDGNAIGEKQPLQYPYSTYQVRNRVTTIGKQEEVPTDPTTPPTDPTTPPTDPTTPPTDPTTPPTDPTTPPTDPTTPPTDPTTPPTEQDPANPSGILD